MNSPTHSCVSFRQFWLHVAQELGDAWLALNPATKQLNEFIASSYDPKAYLRDVILRSYKHSECKDLNSPVDLESVLDILGEAAYGLRGQRRDDLFDIELLEEIAWLIGNHYGHLLPHPEPATHSNAKQRARVVSFPNFRIRRANAQL